MQRNQPVCLQATKTRRYHHPWARKKTRRPTGKTYRCWLQINGRRTVYFRFVDGAVERRFAIFFQSNQFSAVSRISNFRFPYSVPRIRENGCTRNGQTGWVADCGREPNSIFPRFWTLFFSLSIQLCSFTILILSCARTITLGEVGDEFYFVLQGSVKIKLNNKVIKVRFSLRLFASLTALIIAPYHLILMPIYPVLRHLVRCLATRPHSASLRCSVNANALPRSVRATQ